MKCPWIKITKAYADYEETDCSGKPIQYVEEEFKECIEEECPFYNIGVAEIPINDNISIFSRCMRISSEVRGK